MKEYYNMLNETKDNQNNSSLTVYSDAMEFLDGCLFMEITAINGCYKLNLEKSGKISSKLQISLYINNSIMKTFILDNDFSLDLAALPEGRYRLSLGNIRSFYFTLSR